MLRRWSAQYDAQDGGLPPGSCEAGVAYYCLAEMGFWPYKEAFMDLPPELGAEILELMMLNVPHRLDVMQRVLRAIEGMQK